MFGRIPYVDYLALLRVSSAHVYLTVPFVLFWSMLEAMSAGCLVIGSDTAPVREVLEHQENGLLVDFFSPRQIADAVDEVFAYPDRMKNLRHQACETLVSRYPVAHSLAGYRTLIGILKGAANRQTAGITGDAEVTSDALASERQELTDCRGWTKPLRGEHRHAPDEF